MSFYARLALLSIFGAALLSTSSFASAQVIDDHDSGYPIQLRVVVIQSGTTTRFRTDYNLELAPGASNADTVLSLIQIGGGFLGGADGWDCSGAPFTWGPSCFDYTNNSGTTQVAYLVARSWSPNSPSRGRLWRDSAYLPDNYNGNSTDKVWFGGDWITQPIASSGRQHLSTTHRPGGADRHLMVIGSNDAYNSAEVVHRLEFGTSIVWGLAELDQIGSGSLPTNVGIAYGGRNRTNFGPVRLLKNNWFASGADNDGDGLGHALEVDLGTCDRPSDTMPNGQGCATLEFCTTNPSSDVCMARLRDTDHDGLRDDVEVYGYDDPLTHMPRYGANPVHRDVFIEMNTVDRDGTQICQGFTSDDSDPATWPVRMGDEPLADNDFFDRFQRIYDNAPASMNPDGNPGIEIHFDVGIANPDPLSAAWNDWGGGNDCLATASAGACAANIEADRSWLFRCAVDSPSGGGKAGGQSWWGGTTAHHVHELSHVLGLHHGGPYGAAANTVDSGNKRPLYVSRVNYRYQDVGTSGAGVWDAISFSRGLLGLPTNARFAVEEEPIPGADLSALLEGAPPALADQRSSGEWDVDWNQDGDITDDERVWEAYRDQENGRNARGYKSKSPHANLLMGHYGDHMDAAVTNGVLVFAFSEDDHLYFMANSDGECDMTSSPANTGERESYNDCMALGSRFNTSHSGQAVSIARTLLPGFSNPPPLPDTEGMVMVYRDGNKLYWREVDVTPNTSAPAQAGFQLSGGGYLRAVGTGPHQVTLAEVPVSPSNPHGGVMAFVVENGGNLEQAFLPAGSATWSSFGDVQLSGGGGTFGEVAGTVGAVAHDGLLYMAARRIVPGGGASNDELRIYTMPGGSNHTGQWTEVDNFSAPGAEAVEIAFTPPPTGEDDDEMFVLFRQTTGLAPRIMQRRWPKLINGTQQWSLPSAMGLTSREYSFASAAVVFDDRAVAVGAHGLRAFRDTHRGCNTQPTTCGSSGYHPGITSGELFCDGLPIAGTFRRPASAGFSEQGLWVVSATAGILATLV